VFFDKKKHPLAIFIEKTQRAYPKFCV